MNYRAALLSFVSCVVLLSWGCPEPLATVKPQPDTGADGGAHDAVSVTRGGRTAIHERDAATGDAALDDTDKEEDAAVVQDAATQAPSAPVTSTDTDAKGCRNGGFCQRLDPGLSELIDVLFVVDNSGSMRQEQATLRASFPRLIERLTGTGSEPGQRAARDLHLGVVSVDMGLVGVPNNYPSCNDQRHVDGGDDGVLLHAGNMGPDCAATYPAFLSYEASSGDPAQLAHDFGCIANLGTTGCGFEQQLEAGLKALWPKNYVDENGVSYPPEQNPITFLATSESRRYGHGDVPVSEGGNGGFLRNDPSTGLSRVAIVIVTDEEDCSSANTGHFISTNDPANPLSKQGINLRCYYNEQNLYKVTRYIEGFPKLRPNHPSSVVFGAVVGVPPELVAQDARTGVDFSDAASRDAYYDRILMDERMQYRVTDEQVPALANLAPSCSRMDASGELAQAYPPRRFVQVAKGLGENAFVQSICQDDFSSIVDVLVERLARDSEASCLPERIERGSDGTIDCELIWQLPEPGSKPGTPSTCSELPFLKEVDPQRSAQNAHGGANCALEQLAVVGGMPAAGEGFYYDDFSAERSACELGKGPRIAFTPAAKPPEGVEVLLDCSR